MATPSFITEDAGVSRYDGESVFNAIETRLLASLPSWLKLPAASLNALLETLINPVVVLLSVGVKVALYLSPLPEKLLRAPPATETSDIVKLVDSSLNVNVMVDVLPLVKLVSLTLRLIVGGVVSAIKLDSKYVPSEKIAYSTLVTVSVPPA